jgi:hypothetical protein
MSKKSKTPKFNSVLEDFRKFAGLKVAEEQGDKEQSISLSSNDADVKAAIPAGGKVIGATVDPLSNKGTSVNEKAPDTKEPKKEEETTKEVSPSAKVAQEDEELVNNLLNSISLVVSEQTEKVAAEVKEEVKEEGKEVSVSANPEMPCEDKKASEEAPEGINEDVLAAKIASHFRQTSVGYELGKFLFQTLGQKVAEDMVPPEAAQEVPPEVAAGMEAGGAPVEGGSDEGDEVAMILQAIQELVAEGQISEEQAQAFLTELEGALQGGGEGAPAEGAEMEPQEASEEAAEEDSEESKEAAVFTPEQEAAMVAAVNEKVAELVAEGKTDAEIESFVKEAAVNDAEIIGNKLAEEKVIVDYVENKIASAVEAGASEEQVQEYVKFAAENPEAIVEEIQTIVGIANAVEEKAAELKAQGHSEEEIEAYIKEAAANDAATIQKEQIKASVLSKVAADRQQKVAEGEMPPEMQQILQALEELLQSGQITEEEAMAVLQELGIGAEGGMPPEGAAPEAPVPQEAPMA